MRSFFFIRWAPWFVAIGLLALVAAKFDRESGFVSLLRFGENWSAHQLPTVRALDPPLVANSAGYDGQFYAQIALDPLLRDPNLQTALDSPAYRARRILMPAIAHLFGLGDPYWILQAFALTNVACWILFAWLLWRELLPRDAFGLARWLACVCSMGVLESVRQSLVDLPALLLLLLAVRAQSRGQKGIAAGAAWCAWGHLAKETNLLATVALFYSPGQKLARTLMVIMTALPLAAWAVYVQSRMPGGALGLGNFSWPLGGAFNQIAIALRDVLGGTTDSRHLFALVAIPSLFLQAWVIIARRELAVHWWRIGVVYAVLLVFLGPWVWSGYWAACRAVLPMTIAFNLLLPAGRYFWLLWVAGNISLLHAIWRFL